MPEIIKVAKFKTNISFVGSDGAFHAGGSIVTLPAEDFEGQLNICQLFNLPVPELIEEIDSVVEDSVVEEVKKRARARTASSSKEEQPVGEVDADL